MNYVQDANGRILKALEIINETKNAVLGYRNIQEISSYFKHCFKKRDVVLVADSNTFEAAGRNINSIFSADNELNVFKPYIFDEEELHAEYKYVERLREYLKKCSAIPVAVGSGTVNDIVKLASSECGLEYMIIPTAASVDGYTAYGASITKDNYKQTISCPAPSAIFSDIDIIANAPAEMNAAGYADLIAKIPAGADWIIADALGIESINTTAWKLLQDNLRDWVSNPEGIEKCDHKALTGLMEGLIMSGISMQYAQTSRPASGAEHLFSHLLDNHNYKYKNKTPLHGIKVGIGSIESEKIYEKMLLMNSDDINPDLIKAKRPEWKIIEQNINKAFSDKSLAEQVIIQSKKKYIDSEELASRWSHVKKIWPELKIKLKDQVYGSEMMTLSLEKAGAPFAPLHIGLDEKTVKETLVQAQYLRERYTVLDFVFEAGWWDSCVSSL